MPTSRIPIRIWFLFAICSLYVVSFDMDPEWTSMAFRNFFDSFLAVLPILAFVFLIIFLEHVFLKPEAVGKYLGAHSGAKGWVVALLGSIFVSGPQYVMFPLLKELKEQGMRNSLIAVFLNNRNVQPAFLPVMVYYFGSSFTVTFSALILSYALLSGVLVEYFVKD